MEENTKMKELFYNLEDKDDGLQLTHPQVEAFIKKSNPFIETRQRYILLNPPHMVPTHRWYIASYLRKSQSSIKICQHHLD